VAPAVPASWRHVSAGGVSLAVPTSWLVDGAAYVSTVEGKQCTADYTLWSGGGSTTIVNSDEATPPYITP
jgi:hypothetical protein